MWLQRKTTDDKDMQPATTRSYQSGFENFGLSRLQKKKQKRPNARFIRTSTLVSRLEEPLLHEPMPDAG